MSCRKECVTEEKYALVWLLYSDQRFLSLSFFPLVQGGQNEQRERNNPGCHHPREASFFSRSRAFARRRRCLPYSSRKKERENEGKANAHDQDEKENGIDRTGKGWNTSVCMRATKGKREWEEAVKLRVEKACRFTLLYLVIDSLKAKKAKQ